MNSDYLLINLCLSFMRFNNKIFFEIKVLKVNTKKGTSAENVPFFKSMTY